MKSFFEDMKTRRALWWCRWCHVRVCPDASPPARTHTSSCNSCRTSSTKSRPGEHSHCNLDQTSSTYNPARLCGTCFSKVLSPATLFSTSFPQHHVVSTASFLALLCSKCLRLYYVPYVHHIVIIYSLLTKILLTTCFLRKEHTEDPFMTNCFLILSNHIRSKTFTFVH